MFYIPYFCRQVIKLDRQTQRKILYKTIKTNKAPIILDKSLAMKIDPYKKIGENLLNKRAELMKKNEKFSQDICNILKEAAEEKMETASQEDIEPEESIYSGGFISPKDEALFPKFHSSDWKEKFALLDKFQDDRLVTFGHGLAMVGILVELSVIFINPRLVHGH